MNNNCLKNLPDVIKVGPSEEEVFTIFSVGVLFTIAVYKAVQYFKPKPKTPSAKSGTNYVFCSAEGQAVALSEHDVFSIVQMYKDGVLPSVIASKYNVNADMVCRIVNGFNSKNQHYEQNKS